MRYETTYSGYIGDANNRPIACPRCRQMTGHTVFGRAGGEGRLRCRNGHTFGYPRGVDARARLAQSINDSRRVRT
jgi:hypothetical protein